jgi:hypothetical protein
MLELYLIKPNGQKIYLTFTHNNAVTNIMAHKEPGWQRG